MRAMRPSNPRSVLPLVALAIAGTSLLGGCVLQSTYSSAMDRWQRKYEVQGEKLTAAEKERDDLKARVEWLESRVDEKSKELSATSEELAAIDARLTEKEGLLTNVEKEKKSLATAIEELKKQGETLRSEREALLAEKVKLDEERKQLSAEVQELRRLRSAAEERSREYKKLLGQLAKMIDAGSLEVKIRNGLMLVTLPSDVLFAPGEATLKAEAVESIKQLAATLKEFKGRKFQVIGHSDSQPISNEHFKSNWELSTARAMEVVRVLISAGVPPAMLSAAGAAEFDPVASNRSAKGRALNRRVELVFVPKVQELPGAEELLGKK